MSYLLDRQLKRKKNSYIMLGIVVLLLLFFFRVSVSNSLSSVSHAIFRPVLILGNNIGQKFTSLGSYFSFKKSLSLENENLKLQITQSEADRANYLSVLSENNNLKEILGRKKENQNLIVSAILAKPNRSIYDTLFIDAGKNQGINNNSVVFAEGNFPIGHISEVYTNSSKVILYSNPGEKTEVVIPNNNTFIQIVGRGGGNFEILLPKDLSIQNGTEVITPGVNPYVLGIVVKTISDPRDAFVKALLVSPVNIQSLKFVQVKI